MHSAPTWDPQQYLRHQGHRTRPFLDLLARISDLPDTGGVPARIADLGCGPGNVTALLAERWPTAHITGLDSSREMLAKAEKYAGTTPGGGFLEFREADAAHWTPDGTYDLIVSNAALQWVPNHPESFPRWIEHLRPGGVFAFQVLELHLAQPRPARRTLRRPAVARPPRHPRSALRPCPGPRRVLDPPGRPGL